LPGLAELDPLWTLLDDVLCFEQRNNRVCQRYLPSTTFVVGNRYTRDTTGAGGEAEREHRYREWSGAICEDSEHVPAFGRGDRRGVAPDIA
jgi:hypothetical protein